MEITLLQSILVGVVYYLGFVGTPWFLLLGGISIIQKPLVAGVLVGMLVAAGVLAEVQHGFTLEHGIPSFCVHYTAHRAYNQAYKPPGARRVSKSSSGF